MNNIKKNQPMFFWNYADEIQLLFLKRYLLITEIAENGPYIEEECYYNPDDIEPVIEKYDVVTALAEIDQQILDLVTKASEEDWFSGHKSTMYGEKNKMEKRLNAIAEGLLGKFPF